MEFSSELGNLGIFGKEDSSSDSLKDLEFSDLSRVERIQKVVKNDDPGYVAARKPPEVSNYLSGLKKGLEGDSDDFDDTDDFGDVEVSPVSQPATDSLKKKIRIKVDK